MKITVTYTVELNGKSISQIAFAEVAPEEVKHCETLPDRLWNIVKNQPFTKEDKSRQEKRMESAAFVE